MAASPRLRTNPPTLTPAQARDLYAYNERVYARFSRAVRRRGDRAARRRRGIGHESLFDTLAHILNVHEVWVVYIVQGRSSDAELTALFQDRTRHPKDWAGLRRYERRVWSAIHAYLAGVTPRKLRTPVRADWMPGRYVASDGLWQASFEQAHHLGEIIGALWQDDAASPPMTWIQNRRAAR